MVGANTLEQPLLGGELPTADNHHLCSVGSEAATTDTLLLYPKGHLLAVDHATGFSPPRALAMLSIQFRCKADATPDAHLPDGLVHLSFLWW